MDRTIRAKSAISAVNTSDNSSIISFDSPASFYILSIQNKNITSLANLLKPLDDLLLSLANYPNGLFFDTLIKTLTNNTYFSLMNNLYSLRYNTADTSPEFETIVASAMHSLETLRRFINIYDETKLTELRVAIENSKLNNYNASVSGIRNMDNLVDNSFNVVRIKYSNEYANYLKTFGYSGDDAILPYLTGVGTYR
jgi:hypothetical protein